MSNKLLLADDSVTIQKVVGIIFSNEEYELTVVDNGNAALEKAREVHPDIMLVDAIMPGINGYEVCQEIRRDPDLKNTALLLLTGAFEPFDEEKARQCGADDCISKPFDSQSLIESVKKLIAIGRDRASTLTAPIPSVPTVEPVFAPGAAEPVGFAPEPVVAVASSDAEAIPEPAPAAADDDLWGVFELEEGGVAEPAAQVEEVPAMEGFAEPAAADAFSFADLDASPEPAYEPAIESTATDFGATWVPVGEQEFHYDEPAPGGATPSLATEPFPAVAVETVEPSSFAESSFVGGAEEAADFGGFEGLVEPVPAELPTESFEQAFAPEEEIVSAPAAPVQPEPVAEAAQVTAIPATVALDEEQLRALLASVSREVIERIVWEVVPDLAETIIKEEIRKIKAGIGD